MKFNTTIKLGQLKNDFEIDMMELRKIGYDKLVGDAVWKYAGILNAIRLLNCTPFEKAIELGGGLSPLQFMLSNFGKILNNDLSFTTWFPTTPGTNFYSGSPGIPSKPENIEYINESFFDFVKNISDNSIDFCYDGCSLIHFNPSITSEHKNLGCYQAAVEMKRILKPGGYFISCSDVLSPTKLPLESVVQNQGEWLYPENLIQCYIDGGLIPVDEPDFNYEPYFLNPENIFIRPGGDYLAIENDKPDEHQMHRLPDNNISFPSLAIARFVLQKQ